MRSDIVLKIAAGLFGGLTLVASAVAADVPPVPTAVFSGCINGNVSVVLSADGSITNHWFQMKELDVPGSDWRTVEFTRYETPYAARTVIAYSAPSDFAGAAAYRVAETNAAGEYASWLELSPVTNYVRHTGGTVYGEGNNHLYMLTDGRAYTLREAAYKHQGTTNLVFGISNAVPMSVSMIRYVPRQDEMGKVRIVGARFQCADDEAFETSVVELGPLTEDFTPGGVLEIAFEKPVTARYFRILRPVPTQTDNSDYLSIDEIELVRADLGDVSLDARLSEDWTNAWMEISWSVPPENVCSTGVLQRAVSKAGPFIDVSEWTDATAGGTIVDTDTAAGVTYYYRVRMQCMGGGHRGIFDSEPAGFVRCRRLERDPEDFTRLRDGVSVLPAYEYRTDVPYKYESVTTPISAAFDGDIETIPEISCWTTRSHSTSYRMRNPVVGVDLGEGAAARVVFAHTYPRTNQLERSRRMAIFGANESDLSDRVQLSEELGGFPFNAYDWQCNTTTIQNEAFRYVFLLSPTDYATFGNIAEVGFYGYSEQDIVDSGILIPPTEVACATNFHGATLSWDRGWNAESYVLERRIAGSDGPWKRLVTLATDVHSYEDASVPRSGTWEWRITAEAEGKDPISSLPCAAFLDPHLGAVIIIQ